MGETEELRVMHEKNANVIETLKAGLSQNSLLNITLNRLDRAVEDAENNLIIQIKSSELKNYSYEEQKDDLEKLVNNLVIKKEYDTDLVVKGYNKNNETYEFIPLIRKANCDDGTFTLIFAPEIKEYVYANIENPK